MRSAKMNSISRRTCVGQLAQVLLVVLRQDHPPHAGPPRRQHLLLDAADRQHQAAQRDLAGHGRVAARPACRCTATPAPSPSPRPPTGRPWAPRRPGRGCGRRAAGTGAGRCPAPRRATRRSVCAARADSCITSPSWPVSRSPRPLGSRLASMYSTSPPASVQARPGRHARLAAASRDRSGRTRSGPSRSARSSGRPSTGSVVPLGEAPRHLAGQPAQRPLQLAHAGLAGVAADDAPQRLVGRSSAAPPSARPAQPAAAAGSGAAISTFSSSL